MGNLESVYVNLSPNTKKKVMYEKEKILQYLNKLKVLEAKLWGIIINDISSDEEKILEDTNHLIYLYSRGHKEDLNKILSSKNVKQFTKDLEKLRKDFLILKKEIREKEKLKLLISNFTIKLVDSKNYMKFKDVFLLEKMLYEVLDKQDEELNKILDEISKIKINTKDNKIEVFTSSLREIRKILAGHIEYHNLFEEERQGYSNTSNILHQLIKIFEKNIE